MTEQVMTVFCFCIQRGGKVPLTQAELPESCIRAKYVFWTVTAPIYTRHPKCGNWSGFIFDGGTAALFLTILRNDMPFFYTLLDSPAQLEAIWNRLYETLLKKNNINELLISQDISQILTLLGLSKERREKQKTASDFMDISLKYIHRHLDEDISLNALAARVSLSPFYFTRKFKEETGYTPYRYILISRINLAKFYLKSSRDTVKKYRIQLRLSQRTQLLYYL